MFTSMKNEVGTFVYQAQKNVGSEYVIAREKAKFPVGLYNRLRDTRSAREGKHRVAIVGAALVGAENAPDRPYFILKCGHDWLLTAVYDGIVSDHDMAGLVAMSDDIASAVERHNREWRPPWAIKYLELWDETT